MFETFTQLADFATYTLAGLERGTKAADALHFFIEDTSKIFVLLAVMIYVIGFGRSFVSPEKVRLWLTGKSRATGYVLAALLGAVTPFCSCSSVPLFIAFLSAGIPLGVTMSFLITSPLVNEVAVILLGEAMGMTFTITYVTTGMVIGIAAGALTDLFKLKRFVEPFVWSVKLPAQGPTLLSAESWRWRESFARQEALDIIKRVWLYVLIGVGLGAALHGYVPQDWLITHAGSANPLAVPLAVLMGIPLYANATSVVPVAEVLLQKGVPVGTVLAFIMSVVGISLPEILILRKVLKPQMIAFFIGVMFCSLILVGYLFNAVFGG